MAEAKTIVHVVDDDRSVRLSLVALLKSHGYAAESFDSAEAYLESGAPAGGGCLLVDVRMPGMSGLDLLKRLSEESLRLPVIVITGHGDVPMAVAAMKAGAVDFLEKPYTDEILLAALDRALRTSPASAGSELPPGVVAERLERLTPREREVLDHLVLGEINKVIAHRLNISQRTVEIHRARIKEKMEAQSLADLIRMMM